MSIVRDWCPTKQPFVNGLLSFKVMNSVKKGLLRTKASTSTKIILEDFKMNLAVIADHF